MYRNVVPYTGDIIQGKRGAVELTAYRKVIDNTAADALSHNVVPTPKDAFVARYDV